MTDTKLGIIEEGWTFLHIYTWPTVIIVGMRGQALVIESWLGTEMGRFSSAAELGAELGRLGLDPRPALAALAELQLDPEIERLCMERRAEEIRTKLDETCKEDARMALFLSTFPVMQPYIGNPKYQPVMRELGDDEAPLIIEDDCPNARDLWLSYLKNLRDRVSPNVLVTVGGLVTEDMPPPSACLINGCMQLSWDCGEHHLEFDVRDHGFDWFYRNRKTEDCASGDGYALPIDPLVRARLDLFRTKAPMEPDGG